MSVTPYKNQVKGKKEQVAEMFDNISPRYDLLNRLLSAGIDIQWRKKAIRLLGEEQPKLILDVATGTGDLALEALAIQPEKIIGVDISAGMLEYGRKKINRLGYHQKIELKLGDSENLQFEDETFDAVMVAFGVRNFENLEKGLTEIHRVLKKGGTLLVLEFSQPESFPFKQIYKFYFSNILPLVGKVISKDNSAYTYLPDSVKAFPYGKTFTNILEKLGYNAAVCRPLTLGICSIYTAKK